MLPRRILLVAGFLVGCAGTGPVPGTDDPLDGLSPDSDGKADAVGLYADFDKNRVMENKLYLDPSYASVEELQAFLENTPWNRPSWLASYTIEGVPASQAIVEVAVERGLNPLMLLSRVQVESSLISKSELPDGRQGQFAFGCHKVTAEHPNGLDPSVASFEAQLDCATRTFQNLYAKVIEGRSVVTPGKRFVADDGVEVVADNEATAALYSYTPFTCPGNCLVWYMARRFDRHLQTVIRR